jgi:hypothetical protein
MVYSISGSAITPSQQARPMRDVASPLERELAQGMLRVLDRLVDMGDRRSAALQTSETFKNVRL